MSVRCARPLLALALAPALLLAGAPPAFAAGPLPAARQAAEDRAAELATALDAVLQAEARGRPDRTPPAGCRHEHG